MVAEAAPGTRNPWLDAVRALAVCSVLLGHSTLLMPEWPGLHFLLAGGFVGVEIFFVLSGFLIGGILLRTGRQGLDFAALRHFWSRRWLRTLPNYFLFLALAAALALFGLRGQWPADGWKYLLFAQNLWYPHPAFFPEAWSLSVEEVFYLALPLLALLLHQCACLSAQRAVVLVCCLVLLACTAARFGLAAAAPQLAWDEHFRKVVLLRLDALVLGVLLAFGWQRWPGLLRARALHATLLLCFAACLWYVFSTPWGILQASRFAKTWLFNLTSLGCCGLVLCGLRRPFGAWFCACCAWVARLSYSAYLCHFSVAMLLHRYSPLHGFWGDLANLALFWLLSAGLAWLAFHFWESRFLRWRDRAPGPP